MVLDRSLVIVSGKGGVGKSAVTVALALRAQRTGRRVLVAALTNGIGAAAHLGAERLTYEPATFHGDIEAMLVDRAAALDEYLRMQLRVPAAAPTRTLSRAMQVLVDTAPGIREVISMGKPIFDTWQGEYDLVIVDAPPIGQLMSYLRAPAVVAGLVPTGAIKNQAGRMAAALHDAEKAALLLVTTPEELPAIETRQAIVELEAEPLIAIGGIVANRVLPPLGLAPQDIDRLPDRPAAAAAAHHLALLETQTSVLTDFPEATPLPYLFGVRTPAEVSAHLADAWEDAS